MTTTAIDAPVPTVGAGVVVGGRVLAAEAADRVMRVVVDTDLHRPGMVEVTFLDYDGASLDTAGMKIGALVEVWGSSVMASAEAASSRLITGEITSIEGTLHGRRVLTTVRGYSTAHRLQRARRTRTFLDSTDAEIAEEIAVAAGLKAIIEPTTTIHDYLAQVNQTDWDFLLDRAAEIGFEVGVGPDGVFYFRSASTVDRPACLEPATVTFPDTLMVFCPRVSAGNQAAGVEVRVWDPLAAQAVAVAGTATSNSGVPSPLAGGLTTPETLGMEFTPLEVSAPDPLEAAPTLQYLGPEPSDRAYVVNDRPIATGLSIDIAGTSVASAVGQHLGGTFAEAEGEAVGDPAIQPGAVLEVTGVQAQFAGRWLVTHTRHIFDDSEHGYRTCFSAHGTNDRSLLGLTSDRTTRPTIDGVVCGIVSNCGDPNGKGRIKATLPWLSPSFETNWAPVVQFGTGRRGGSMFLPEVGDEVVLGFEFGDPRRPYVLGGIVNNDTAWGLGGPAVRPTGLSGEVVRRGIVSSSGNALIFNDEVPPGPEAGPPIASSVRLGTAPPTDPAAPDPGVVLSLDQVACSASLTCNPSPGVSRLPAGSLTIGATDGEITISTGPGPIGSVTVDGGSELSLKAAAINIVALESVAITAPEIRLN